MAQVVSFVCPFISRSLASRGSVDRGDYLRRDLTGKIAAMTFDPFDRSNRWMEDWAISGVGISRRSFVNEAKSPIALAPTSLSSIAVLQTKMIMVVILLVHPIPLMIGLIVLVLAIRDSPA